MPTTTAKGPDATALGHPPARPAAPDIAKRPQGAQPTNTAAGDAKAERAEDDLDHIGELMDQLSRAFGEGSYTPKRFAAAQRR